MFKSVPRIGPSSALSDHVHLCPTLEDTETMSDQVQLWPPVAHQGHECLSIFNWLRPRATVTDSVRPSSTVCDRVAPISSVSQEARLCPTVADEVRLCRTKFNCFQLLRAKVDCHPKFDCFRRCRTKFVCLPTLDCVRPFLTSLGVSPRIGPCSTMFDHVHLCGPCQKRSTLSHQLQQCSTVSVDCVRAS